MEFILFAVFTVVVIAVIMGTGLGLSHAQSAKSQVPVPPANAALQATVISDMQSFLDEKWATSDVYNMPVGTYHISEGFTIPAGKTLRGDSRSGTRLVLTSPKVKWIQVEGTLDHLTVDGNNNIRSGPIAGAVIVGTNGTVNECDVSNHASKPVHFPFASGTAEWLYDLVKGDYPNIVRDVFGNRTLSVFVNQDKHEVDFLSGCTDVGTGGCFGNDATGWLNSKGRESWAAFQLRNWVEDYGTWAKENDQFIPYETDEYAFGAAATVGVMFVEGHNATVQSCRIFNGKYGMLLWGGDNESIGVSLINNSFNNTLCDAVTTISDITYRNLTLRGNSFCRVGYLCFNGSDPQVAATDLSAIYNLKALNDIPGAAFYSIRCKFENLVIEDTQAAACIPYANLGLPTQQNSTVQSYGVCGNTIDFVEAEVASGVSDAEGGFDFRNNEFGKNKGQIQVLGFGRDPLHETVKCLAGNALNIAYGSSGGKITGNQVTWNTNEGDALSIHNDDGSGAKSTDIAIINNRWVGTVDTSNLATCVIQ